MLRLQRHRALSVIGLLLLAGLAAPTVHQASHLVRGHVSAHEAPPVVEGTEVDGLACDLCDVYSTIAALPVVEDGTVRAERAQALVLRPVPVYQAVLSAGFEVRGPPQEQA